MLIALLSIKIATGPGAALWAIGLVIGLALIAYGLELRRKGK